MKGKGGKYTFRITADNASAALVKYAYSVLETAKRVRELRLFIRADGSEPIETDEPNLEAINRSTDSEDIEIEDLPALEDLLENILRPHSEDEHPNDERR